MKATRKPWRVSFYRFPAYWEELVEAFLLPEDVVSRLEALRLELASSVGGYPTVYVTDRQGEMIHVCMTPKSWILIVHTSTGECRVTTSNKATSETCAFLFPEWTELSKRHLIPKATARKVLVHWLETGEPSSLVHWE